MNLREITIPSIAIIVSAFILGAFFFKARESGESLQVVGSAVQRFDTDIVKWQIRISRESDTNMSAGYTAISADLDRLTEAVRDHGIDESAISVQPVTTQTRRNDDGIINGYRFRQSLTVISELIDVIEDLALNPDLFLAQGMIVDQSNLEYFYSGVDELKRELLGDAAADARLRADAIAGRTGVSVGKLKQADSGVFQITEPFSTEVSAYGIYNTTSREKEIKVTVHAEFLLE